MKRFWGRTTSSSSSPSTTTNNNKQNVSSPPNSLTNGNNTEAVLLASSTLNNKQNKSSSNTNATSTPPTRKQRMQLLKSIIHHADSVQNKYLIQKDLSDPNIPKPQQSISSMFISSDKVTDEINEKCYARWHEVLQEGLVPMSLHALNLLEKSTSSSVGDDIMDEEEQYFATMAGMDEEIQVMAILARAASLNDIIPKSSNEEDKKTSCTLDDKEEDGMEQINAMMKCIAMLLFHIVLEASSSDESSSNNTVEEGTTETFKTVARYDGRVRHVAKLACVDVLSRAIIDSVELYECSHNMKSDEVLFDRAHNNQSPTTSDNNNEQEREIASNVYDMDEYSLWNIANIKTFVDQTNLGKDAIFGTLYHEYKKSPPVNNQGKSSESNEEDDQSVKSGDTATSRDDISRQSDEESTSKQLFTSESADDDEKVFPTTSSDMADDEQDMPQTAVESIESNWSSSFEVQSEEIKVDDSEINVDDDNISLEEELDTLEQELDAKSQESDQDDSDTREEEDDNEEEENVMTELQARRHSNAKYLATRKFELIERLVAIDIVRFLMAEEREKKIREQEIEAQKKSTTHKLPSFLKQDVMDDEDGTADLDDAALEDKMNEALDESSSQFFTDTRVKQMKRSAKIAGMGLALGTVFAITGGLAAPALAAGIGGIAALTGATTASSTALLAVLATFKAGAALFGVGGGGLAAYKMKKRTAGLSQFEIRRENIEQYMYLGASDEKMKKGVETMLPQLHTTVAVCGWLRDNDIADFQLAWGIQPTCKYEKEDDDKRRIRQMKRFYSVYNPPLVQLCGHFMETLKKRLKNDFSWDRIWQQLEQKYGANPDHLLPLDTPHENEVSLSYEEKEMIDGILNDAKIVNLRKRGYGVEEEIDFDEDNDITELLHKMTPKKTHRKNYTGSSIPDGISDDVDLETMETELVDLALSNESDELDKESSGSPSLQERLAKQREQQAEFLKNNGLVYDKPESEDDESESADITAVTGDDDSNVAAPESLAPQSLSLKERMSIQREQQVSFLKDKGLIDDDSKLSEGAGSPKMIGSMDEDEEDDAQDPPPATFKDDLEEFEEERCPVVWDWKRLYGTADIHTVTWESKMLSSLCHIVENLAIEVSSQATKVALQYSVIGAIVSAVAIPSALVTASKLIDDPYQIIVIRADEAGKELAKCLLSSDERRPVTLVGFSFGARVIYSCLRELARQQDIWEYNRSGKVLLEEKKSPRSSFLKKKKDENRFEYDREPASLVADVIFIGLPRAIDRKVLTSCRRVTGGRMVNCYTTNDWLLSLMFVARGGTPCGTKPIRDVPGIENYDVTTLVESHTKYGNAIPSILQHVRFSEPEP